MIYVYAFCLTPPSHRTLPQGIAAMTQWVVESAVAAIVEPDLDVTPLKDDDQLLMTAVLSHDRVLCDAFAEATLLPLRFGTQFTDEASLRAHLRQHQQTYRQRLEALHDKAEYLLKLTPMPWVDEPLSGDLRGRDYFLAKKERLQRQSAWVEQRQRQLEALVAHWQASGVGVVESPAHEGQLRFHVLGDRDSDVDLKQACQAIAPAWHSECSLPLPPYHFAT